MKDHDLEPATKGDLARLATSLDKFATKDDLKRFATKDDLDELKSVVKNMAIEVSGIKPGFENLRMEFSAALTQMGSRLFDHMDGFMAKTVKVESGQFWLIHRMDKLEGRVSHIEKRSP